MRARLALGVLLTAGSAWGYSYYYSDTFASVDETQWRMNGFALASPSGLHSPAPGYLAALIKYGTGYSTGHEVRTELTIGESGGRFQHYLRATEDAMYGSAYGTYVVVELKDLVVSGGACSATLAVAQRYNDVLTSVASRSVGCTATTELRSVMTYAGKVLVFVNGSLALGPLTVQSMMWNTMPGVGVLSVTGANYMKKAELGGLDQVAPSALAASDVAWSAGANSVDFQWKGAQDDAAGTGVLRYVVYRNNVVLGTAPGGLFTDATVAPGVTYQYKICAVDWHDNYGGMATVNVTTAASGSKDRPRTGLRAAGAYWGGAGENVDMQSGNLNFTLPLVTSVGRTGRKVGLGLSYNGQNWRKDANGIWNLGRDIGYGYGWTMTPGSVRAHYSDYWTVDHYAFVDGTGAEYRLDVNESGVWRSRAAGGYVKWNAAESKLVFPDGSWWEYGCVARGGERDAGTAYPTRLYDRNGNVTVIDYMPGVQWGSANSSGRIVRISDVRAAQNWGPVFEFQYTSEARPHLSGITNTIGTGEAYTFGYTSNQTLQAPFAPAGAYGTVQFLSAATVAGLGVGHAFSYGANVSGELVKVTLPYGAEIEWGYGDQLYGDGKTYREVTGRWLRPSSGAAQLYYQIAAYAPGGVGTVVDARGIIDPTGKDRWWYFETIAAALDYGLARYFEERDGAPNYTRRLQTETTWVQDSGGRLYAGTVVTRLDAWTADMVTSKVETSMDGNGNVTEQRFYDYGSLTTPMKTVGGRWMRRWRRRG